MPLGSLDFFLQSLHEVYIAGTPIDEKALTLFYPNLRSKFLTQMVLRKDIIPLSLRISKLHSEVFTSRPLIAFAGTNPTKNAVLSLLHPITSSILPLRIDETNTE
jgi:hypothetical protein